MKYSLRSLMILAMAGPPIRDLLLVTIIVIAGGCSWGGSQSRQPKAKPAPGLVLSEKRDEARSQLLKEIPLGVAMDIAGERLISLGFETSMNSPDERVMRLKRSRDWVDIVWIVQLHGTGGKLADMDVEVGYIGP